ncbi:Metallo-dependent phosphatase-like protein [Obelidium mucronatum]|nr:Metallo-dependent phosphatase-like protein [Obelidium mucronatum]
MSTTSSSSPRRIVAVGDFHGDFPQVHKVLRMAGILDKQEQWIGGPNTAFVHTGDVVDRGPDTIKLFQMLQRLYNDSLSADYDVFPLLGNHEIMNLSGDLRYVTEEDYASFGGQVQRKQAWSENGWIGNLLMKTLSNVTLELDGTVFVHGGIAPEWARLGVDGLNSQVKEAMKRKEWRDPIFGGQGPFWFRGYAQDREAVICKELKKALKFLKAKRMVIGHTPQYETGEILSRCNGRVFVIDVGISSAYGANCAALEIPCIASTESQTKRDGWT